MGSLIYIQLFCSPSVQLPPLRYQPNFTVVCLMFFNKESLEDAELSVEIELDNSNHNFPVSTDTLSVKKQVDSKLTVRHYINGKVVSAVEYGAVLESGGVGRSASFAFLSNKVVSRLADSNGEEIYELLKGLSGARIYDQKKEESIAILNKAGEIIS